MTLEVMMLSRRRNDGTVRKINFSDVIALPQQIAIPIDMNKILIVVTMAGIDARSAHNGTIREENVGISTKNTFPLLHDIAVHVDKNSALTRMHGAARKQRVAVVTLVGVVAQGAGKID